MKVGRIVNRDPGFATSTFELHRRRGMPMRVIAPDEQLAAVAQQPTVARAATSVVPSGRSGWVRSWTDPSLTSRTAAAPAMTRPRSNGPLALTSARNVQIPGNQPRRERHIVGGHLGREVQCAAHGIVPA